jgi:hypothetical protein
MSGMGAQPRQTDFRPMLTDATEVLNSRCPGGYITIPTLRPVCFFSDQHGDVQTFRAIRQYQNGCTVVGLGDYVDRTPSKGRNLESIAMVEQLVLAVLAAPEHFIPLRGDHEFEQIYGSRALGSEIGLTEELAHAGQLDLLPYIELFFRAMPYAAATENGVLGVHSGVPRIIEVQQLIGLTKGHSRYDSDPIVRQLLWNENVHPRRKALLDESGIGLLSDRDASSGLLYGDPLFSEAMSVLGKSVLVRGHDASASGDMGSELGYRIMSIHSSRHTVGGAYKTRPIVAIVPDPNKLVASTKDLVVEYVG